MVKQVAAYETAKGGDVFQTKDEAIACEINQFLKPLLSNLNISPLAHNQALLLVRNAKQLVDILHQSDQFPQAEPETDR